MSPISPIYGYTYGKGGNGATNTVAGSATGSYNAVSEAGNVGIARVYFLIE